jgi:hypothetical protein
MCNDSDWQSDAEAKKQRKREAADKFLQATLDDPALRAQVLADRNAARAAFISIGKIDVPEGVEFICVSPDRTARNNLVVFVLPTGPQPPGAELWRQSWVAAWEPY